MLSLASIISAKRQGALVAAALFAISCSGDSLNNDDRSPTSKTTDKDESSASVEERDSIDRVVAPPCEYYNALLEDRTRRAKNSDGLSLAPAPQVLWLNFNGATLRRGYRAGESFILCKSTATIPPANISATDQAAIVERVQKYYDNAGSHLVLTLEKPATGDYTTMHIGGTYADLGCSGSGVLGIAPFDRNNLNRNDIAFSFTRRGGSVTEVSDTITHEGGHSFGLNHVSNIRDLMYPSLTRNSEGFLASKLLNSTRVQDGPALLRQALGDKVNEPPPEVKPPPSTTPGPVDPGTRPPGQGDTSKEVPSQETPAKKTPTPDNLADESAKDGRQGKTEQDDKDSGPANCSSLDLLLR